MKIIHCADIHLDSKMTTNLTNEQAKERRDELLNTFSKMVDYAKQNEVKAILIAGDLFDTRNISASARNVVKEAILGYPDIDFVYLKGNHDHDNFLSNLEDLPVNLKLFNDKEWKSYEYGNIVITGLELTDDNQYSVCNDLQLEGDKFNIVTLHGQIREGEGNPRDFIINLDNLRGRNIDYLALGHIHSYEEDDLDRRGKYCYPGCLEGRGFDECGKKGFVLLDIDEETKELNTQFVPFAKRNIHNLEVDISGVSTTIEALVKVEESLRRKEYKETSLVKITLTGAVDVESDINTRIIEGKLEGKFYTVKVVDETSQTVKYQDYERDRSLKGEFIRLVLNSDDNDFDDKDKNAIIKCGIKALLGEDL
ncbi:metallophosphoesterase family protein [Lachnobacterium bovis]|uniref:DNA repair exonuclease SbcCD nuclease subunit n=1 Tax=Lachnobacterium bovis DSM 14045 TaxID=1122142 RepID=A0A1H3I9E5_9FIRM|nr:metallophosphoesterase [Lachnobacterium bovis]MBQ1802819.1 metallophosphoesterase [Lachnobacterium sp.]SDY24300.1 DNA repair exonuclease SbcCD nuclease subunit [Lachnobacterium bovis DSM 14045]